MPVILTKTLLLTLSALLLSTVSGLGSPGAIPADIEKLFPIGRTFSGVKIPSYSDDILKTVLEADKITRVDNTNLDLTNLVISFYAKDGSVESTVSMDRARYHIPTQQLMSKTPAKVKHEKFVMTGDQLQVDTKGGMTAMEGNVRVVVPNASQFTGNLSKENFRAK